MNIKPIETAYRGYRFRSRLEARWAVFFDTLKIPWEYEKEGFDLGNGMRYLPDFWLPEQKWWFEVKGEAPSKDDQEKMRAFCVGENRIAVACGSIPDPNLVTNEGPSWDGNWWSGISIIDSSEDNHYAWCQCENCGTLDIKFEARSDRMKCKPCWKCKEAFYTAQYEVLQKHGPRIRNLFDLVTPILAKSYKCKQAKDKFLLCGTCLASKHGDRGHNGNAPLLIQAYAAARSARFEHGETP